MAYTLAELQTDIRGYTEVDSNVFSDSVLSRIIKNAENKVANLKAEGYPAALAEVNPKGLYRVAYGRYNSKKEAVNMLYFLKYTLKEDAWYLEER